MKSFKMMFAALVAVMMVSTNFAYADSNGAVGAGFGAVIGGIAGSKATKNGKPMKHGAAYGAGVGAVLGALLAPSNKKPDINVNVTTAEQPNNVYSTGQEPVAATQAPQVIYQPYPERVVYVIQDNDSGYRRSVDVQRELAAGEAAYWRGYRDGGVSQYRRDNYGYDYGCGYRRRDGHCRY